MAPKASATSPISKASAADQWHLQAVASVQHNNIVYMYIRAVRPSTPNEKFLVASCKLDEVELRAFVSKRMEDTALAALHKLPMTIHTDMIKWTLKGLKDIQKSVSNALLR